jgi:hypothetical protein
MSVMDHNQIVQSLLQGGIVLMGRRIEPRYLGSLSHLAPGNPLTPKIMEFASSLSPYDTLEFNYGDQKFILYKLSSNICLATLNTPPYHPQILEEILPLLR